MKKKATIRTDVKVEKKTNIDDTATYLIEFDGSIIFTEVQPTKSELY